jgi:hypothetical protein
MYRIRDCTVGFRAIRTSVLSKIDHCVHLLPRLAQTGPSRHVGTQSPKANEPKLNELIEADTTLITRSTGTCVQILQVSRSDALAITLHRHVLPDHLPRTGLRSHVDRK